FGAGAGAGAGLGVRLGVLPEDTSVGCRLGLGVFVTGRDLVPFVGRGLSVAFGSPSVTAFSGVGEGPLPRALVFWFGVVSFDVSSCADGEGTRLVTAAEELG